MLAAMIMMTLGAAPVYLVLPRPRGWLVALVPLVLVGFLGWVAGSVTAGEVLQERAAWGVPRLGIELVLSLDALSLLFALLITGIGTVVMFYASYDLLRAPRAGVVLCQLLLLMGVVLGLVLAANTLVLAMCWQLAALLAYLLAGYQHEDARVRYGTQQMLLLLLGGGVALLAGLLLLGQVVQASSSVPPTATYTWQGMVQAGAALTRSSLATPAITLILIGCCTAAAQVPLHGWLLQVQPVPPAVRAYLPATMGLAGVYLLARLHPLLGTTGLWSTALTLIGTSTLLAGGAMAWFQREMKRVLAYLALSQLGSLVLLAGLGGSAAATGLVVGVLTYAPATAALSLLLGLVERITRTGEVCQPGPLRSVMPVTTALAILAALLLGGMPLLLGFVARTAFFAAIFTANTPEVLRYLVLLLAIVGVALNVAALWRLIVQVFFTRQRGPLPPTIRDAPMRVLLAPGLLAGLGLLASLPSVGPLNGAERLLTPAASLIAGIPVVVAVAAWHYSGLTLGTTLLTLLLGLGLTRLERPLMETFSSLLHRPYTSRGYNGVLRGLQSSGVLVARLLQHGKLSSYLAVTLLVWLGLVASSCIAFGPGQTTFPTRTEIQQDVLFYEVLVALTIPLGLIAVLRARSRLVALVATVMVQGMVALLFILLSAPDVALLEVLVAALLTVFLLLIFSVLPPRLTVYSSPTTRLRDALVACAVGVLMGGLTLVGSGDDTFTSLAVYYFEQSLAQARGTNVVNVLLADFRGFDTLAISVMLFIVLLGVYGLLRLRQSR